jgi:hypothetical protein
MAHKQVAFRSAARVKVTEATMSEIPEPAREHGTEPESDESAGHGNA